MKFKKFILWILAVALIAVPLNIIPASAASQLSMETYVWNTESQTNIPTSEFYSEDMLTVWVKTVSAADIGGLYLKLSYDAEKFAYIENSAGYLISDSSANLMVNVKTAGTLSAVFDTTKANNIIGGAFLTFSFKVKDITSDSKADFSLSVQQCYDSSSNHNFVDITGGTTEVSLKCATVPQEFLALVEALRTVTVNSATDIAAAEEAFNSLTAQQKTAFKESELFEVFNTAKSRYNACVEAAQLAELDAAAQSFVKDNPILQKNLNDITLADEEAINIVSSAYSKLDARIAKRLSEDVKNKISALEETLEAIIAVDEFKQSYSYIYNSDEAALLASPLESLALVNDALLISGTLSDIAKTKLSVEIGKLNSIKALLEEQIKTNEADAEIEAEVLAYQRVWIKVLSLNKSKVSLKDKTAIELAIQEYNKLSDGAKERLASRYENLTSLLKVIESYDTINNNVSQGSTNNSGTGTPATQTVTKEVVKTVTNTQENTVLKYLKKNTAKVIYWLLILLAVSVICAVYSYIYHNNVKKKLGLNELTDNKEAEEV